MHARVKPAEAGQRRQQGVNRALIDAEGELAAAGAF